MTVFLRILIMSDLLLWVGLIALVLFTRVKADVLWRSLAYHVLGGGAMLSLAPFYWMFATSLKDFQGANQTPPTWLPAAAHYYVASEEGEEIEVGLPHNASTPWSDLREMESVEVGPLDQLNDQSAHYEVAGPSLRRERRPEWSNYAAAWNAPAKGSRLGKGVTFTRYFYVSGLTAVVTTIGVLFTSILAAYAFAKMQFVGRRFFFMIVLATMMVPGQVLLIPSFLILAKLPDLTFGLQWLDNYPALIVPWLASVFSIFLLRQFFVSIPNDYWHAAQLDGASHFTYLWRVVIPLSRPALVTAGIFVFLMQWNSLLWPLIVTTSPEMRTLMVGLQTFNQEMSGAFHLLMAASAMAIAPIVLLYFFLQRLIVEGVAEMGVR
jgi:multiple sugar transport system permease protein